MLERITAWDEILPGILWILILSFYFHYRYNKKGGKLKAKYFLTNYYYKLVFAFIFSFSYAILYGGGDTEAYFKCAEKLNQLFFESPSKYFSEIFNTPTITSYYQNFNGQIGYPPGWIYREPESYFVSKLLSILTFFTFNSYLAITAILSGISASITYRFYEFVRAKKLVDNFKLALAILFIPSLAFWCTGISKDTFVFLSILVGVINGLIILKDPMKLFSKNGIYFFIVILLLLATRVFIMVALLVPLLMSFSTYLSNIYAKSKMFLYFLRLVLFGVAFALIFVFIQKQTLGLVSLDDILEEAVIAQKDFANNKTYGTDRYDLGIKEYSLTGMLSVAPQAIIKGIYGPFLTETKKVSILINAIEGLVLTILTFRFFKPTALRQRVSYLFKNEIIVFSLFFTFILAFMAGFTSSLFGVLVRLRAPLLPFFTLILVVGIWGYHQKEKTT